MAFSVKIIASQKADSGNFIEIEPAWWNYRQLLKEYDFNKEINHGYIDYRLFVEEEAFVNMFLEQQKYLDSGIHAFELWEKINAETLQKISDLIEHIHTYSTLEIRIFEWES